MLAQHLLAAFLVIALPVWDHFETKRLKTHSGPRVKLQSYQMTVAWLWLATAAAAALMGIRPLVRFQGARPASLGNIEGFATGMIASATVTIALFLLVARRSWVIREYLDKSFAKLSFFLPSTTRERWWFAMVCVSAGVCEEMLFRGFLIQYLAGMIGVGAALALASLFFGIAHLYQGFRGVLQTGFIALVFGGIFIVTGSLLAPIVLHTLIDLRVLALYRPPRGQAA